MIRIFSTAGKPIIAAKKAHRAKCGCFASKDIGEYDTCPHGCVYCYAVQNRDLARQNYKAHDPQNEFLLPPKDYELAEDQSEESDLIQGKLF